MNVKEILGTTIGVCSLLGLGYGAALKGGWVIDKAIAQDIAQHVVQKEEQARLEFVRETKFARLQFLNRLQDKTPDDQLELETLREDIKRINARLDELVRAE